MAVIEASALHRVVFRFAIFGHEFVLLSLKWAHRYWKLDISVERTRCHVAYCSTHPKPGRNRAVRFAIKGTLPVTARLGGSSSRLTMSIPGSISPSQLSKIGRAHVCTPVTHAHLVCCLLLAQKTKTVHTHADTT